MTEEEKELEAKTKQYLYEKQKAEKVLQQLHDDTHKGKKKSFILKLNRTIGGIIFAWSGLGFILIGIILIAVVANLIRQFNSFDAVKNVEEMYNIDLKQISREVQDTTLIYKVRLSKCKYKKLQATIIKEGRRTPYDDIEDRCIKYIIENIDDKELLNGFEIEENYNEYDILEYNVIYKILSSDNKEEVLEKVQNLQNYIMNFDKKFNKKVIRNINEKVKIEKVKIEEVSEKTSFFLYL